MQPQSTPYPAVWMSVALPGCRECDDTYCFFPYHELPTLDASLFRGEFQWLDPLEETLLKSQQIHQQTPNDKISQALTKLTAAADDLGITLPASFLYFMGRSQLRAQVPSSTACYFDLSDAIIKDPLDGPGYFIRFLNDQQDVLLWYLYVTPDGQDSVFVSPIPLDAEDLTQIPREVLLNNIGFCGESFESFLYRFWIENTTWFSLTDDIPLTEAQERYLQHYRSRKAS